MSRSVPAPHGPDDVWILAGRVVGAAAPGGGPASPAPDDPVAGLVVCAGRVQRLLGPGERESPPAGVTVLDYRPHLLAPGTIDVHTHGGAGGSFSTGLPEEALAICRYRATTGATGVLATITGVWDELITALGQLGRLGGPIANGATLLGIHVEGPFLNPRRKGAIHPDTLRRPSVDDLQRMQDAAGGAIRMMTIAPELPGAIDVVEAMHRLGIVPSLGHSDATYEQALDGIAAGITKTTHSFNAMRPLHHRDPGVVGATLADPRLTAELIPDGVHVHPGAMRALLAAKGSRQVVLVTDGVRYAGLAEGTYERPGRGRAMLRDGAVFGEDGTLAGSASPMDRNLRLLRERLDIADLQLFTMAAAVPARLLRLPAKGHLHPGADADFGIYDAELTCRATFIAGELVFHQR